MTDIAKPGPDASSLTRALFSNPLKGLAIICALQFLLWTLVPALLNQTPPNDTMEGYLWGREWVLMTYKHPQLPAWFLQITHMLTGSYTWGHFALSQLFIVATFGFVYLLGRELLGPRAALAGVALLQATAVFNWGTRQFNHDVAQMPFWVAICWLLWRATRDNKMGWWIALGLVAGISVFAKFSMGLIILFGALWLFADPKAHRTFRTPGPWVAMAIVAAFAVLTFALIGEHDFLPFTYASGRDGWVLENRGRFYFISVQIAVLLIFPIALVTSGLWRRRKQDPAGFDPRLLQDRRARGYLLWMGAGPALLLAVTSTFTGLGESWSKPMYSLIGLIAVAYLGARLTDRVLTRVARWSVGMMLFGIVTYAIFVPTKCYYLGKLNNACMPGPQIGAFFSKTWQDQTGRPLGIVAGDTGLGWTVGVFASDDASIFTDFDFRFAPWITPERIARQGMLVVWGRGETPPAASATWTHGLPVGQKDFTWADGQPAINVHYVIVPPTLGPEGDT